MQPSPRDIGGTAKRGLSGDGGAFVFLERVRLPGSYLGSGRVVETPPKYRRVSEERDLRGGAPIEERRCFRDGSRHGKKEGSGAPSDHPTISTASGVHGAWSSRRRRAGFLRAPCGHDAGRVSLPGAHPLRVHRVARSDAIRPAAGAALAFFQLLLGPANAVLSRHLLLRILDPADKLVACQGRDVLPGSECRGVRDQRLTQVYGELVHHPTRHALAGHEGE
jgi:hypothetical protein